MSVDRDAILRRRRRLIAAALTSAGITGAAAQGCEKNDGTAPEVCLSPPPMEMADAGEAPPPQVCLSPEVQDPEPEPSVCLSAPAPETSAPAPCLVPPAPKKSP